MDQAVKDTGVRKCSASVDRTGKVWTLSALVCGYVTETETAEADFTAAAGHMEKRDTILRC